MSSFGGVLYTSTASSHLLVRVRIFGGDRCLRSLALGGTNSLEAQSATDEYAMAGRHSPKEDLRRRKEGIAGLSAFARAALNSTCRLDLRCARNYNRRVYSAVQLLLLIALLVSAPWWLLEMLRHGKYRAGLGERLGKVPERLLRQVAATRFGSTQSPWARCWRYRGSSTS